MGQMVNISESQAVPPGFRFHPTEEELLCYYLRKKVANEKIDFEVIREIDLNKLEPWDIQEICRIGSGQQNECYFFSHKDRKYPTGSRTNRATAAGFWKATGRDKALFGSSRRIGLRKTLVFYNGRAPCGMKSEWIMYEYRLDDNTYHSRVTNLQTESKPMDSWVVCRMFKKRIHHKDPIMSPIITNCTPQLSNLSSENSLDQYLLPHIHMGENSPSSLDDDQYGFSDCEQLVNELLQEIKPSCNTNNQDLCMGNTICSDQKDGVKVKEWADLTQLHCNSEEDLCLFSLLC